MRKALAGPSADSTPWPRSLSAILAGERDMIPAGYVMKRVEAKPAWLRSDIVVDVYSVSDCLSKPSCEFDMSRLNALGFFDAPEQIQETARLQDVSLDGSTLFYYEEHEFEYDDEAALWRVPTPQHGPTPSAHPPAEKSLQGYDIVSFVGGSVHECSPLSCNGLAERAPVNEHCLLPSFSEAKELLDGGFFKGGEPGPYRIYAVYLCASYRGPRSC